MNFSNTKCTENLHRFQLSKIFYLLPFLTFSFLVALLGIFVIKSAGRTTFATPGAPGSPGHPATLTTSVSSPTVNFHFNAAELQSSTFKTSSVNVNISTNNETGATTYLSSIDEDTNLNSTDPTISQKFTSIPSETNSSGFTQNKWGYRASTSVPSGNYKPIAKASQADLLYTENTPNTVTYNLEFGVKPSPDLSAGTYTKQILITSVTNYVPTSATFLTGPVVNGIIRNVNTGHDVEFFKKATAAPPVGVHTEIASTADSDLPIYLWYDQVQKTIFWWSNADTVYINEDSDHMLANINDNSTLVQLIDMRGINTSRMKDAHHMFWTKDGLTKHIDLSEFDTSSLEDAGYMFSTPLENNSTIPIDPIDFSRFDTRNLKVMPGMFAGSHLPSIDIRHFNTGNVTDMRLTFSELKNVTHLDLHGLDVSKVNDIGGIFARNPTLVSLNLANWRLDSVHAMDSLFADMYALTSLDLTGFTTKNVTNMAYMFANVSKLADLDLSSFDTSQVTNMHGMFGNMGSLNNINLSSFDTRNVTDMSEMFSMTIVNPPISNLDLSSFNTSNVTDMHGMFQGMANLSNLNLQSFDTRNVTNMKAMFYWAFMYPENSILDLSSFDTRNVTDMGGMFFYSKLKTIYASPSFVTTSVTISPNDPFMSNPNLTGANGTTWDWSKRDRVYARIDAPGNPGFFTQKP